MLLAILIVVLAGCATSTPHREGRLAELVRRADPAVAVCARFWQTMEDAIDRAGVRDGQEVRLSGFPWLRASRPLAGMWRSAGADRTALAREMSALDGEARRAELANLPASERERLVPPGLGDMTVETAVETCRARLSDGQDIATLPAPEVPDDYQTWKRAAGVYPLVRYPFAAGVARYQAETSRTFALPVDRLPVSGTRRRYALDSTPAAAGAAAMPPSFDETTLQDIRAHAPVFDIDVVDDDDRPGFPRLTGDGLPGVDVERPTLFVRVTSQFFAGERRRQIVYGLWFPARPREGAFDLLGGHLDGLLWRVTLDADGRPLLYDSIHPCGCYHQFFPTPAVRVRPAPDAITEWAFVPQVLPAAPPGARIVLRVAARTHFLQRVTFEDDRRGAEALVLAADDVLRSLPDPRGGRRSLFGPDGLVRGTERGERWLFWPMGIREPGSMRQWGRHATAFIGRRHFDDADLLDRHFEPVR